MARMLTGSRPARPAALHSADSVHGALVFEQGAAGGGLRRCRLAAAGEAPLLRLNTVCPYYTMFPLDFPLKRLARARAGERVLDPFCGRGTTLFAARLRGVECVGIDSNPIAAAVAAAKLAATNAEAVVQLARGMFMDYDEPRDVPEGEFWELCYHPATLRSLCFLRHRLLQKCDSPAEVVLRALMLGLLHGPRQKGPPTYLSNQMPRTYATKPAAAVRFWRQKQLTSPAEVDVLDAIARRATYTLADPPPPVTGAVYFGDARQAHEFLPKGKGNRFNRVITSPPYFGMRTYRPDQWLRNWFLGGDATVDYGQEGQLTHHAERFADELALVWRAVGQRCVPGAQLVVRFGYLPSIPVDARDLLRSSLKNADVGWRISRWVDAGSSANGKRQSTQFGRSTATAACEIDAYARLEA